jgi:hypothetical protein
MEFQYLEKKKKKKVAFVSVGPLTLQIPEAD